MHAVNATVTVSGTLNLVQSGNYTGNFLEGSIGSTVVFSGGQHTFYSPGMLLFSSSHTPSRSHSVTAPVMSM